MNDDLDAFADFVNGVPSQEDYDQLQAYAESLPTWDEVEEITAGYKAEIYRLASRHYELAQDYNRLHDELAAADDTKLLAGIALIIIVAQGLAISVLAYILLRTW